MSETTEATIPTSQENQGAATPPTQDLTARLQQEFWGEPTVTPTTKQEPVKTTTAEVKVEDDFETVEPDEWFKNEFKDYGFESAAKAKDVLKEWKEKVEKTPEEIKFENDQSKNLFELIRTGKTKEVYQILDQQERLDRLTDGEVNEKNAADIIKWSMKNKYKEFSDSDVERKFNKQFGIPKEPTQTSDELDEEFKTRYDAWKNQVDEIKQDMILEAKTLRPELETQKQKIVLPEIFKNESVQAPSQEDLQKAKEYKDSFLKNASTAINDFNGFSVTVKDKDVEIPISYGLSNEEKKSLSEVVAAFAEGNYDPYTFLKDRWITKDGGDNISQVVKDLSWLMYGEKAVQKFASDAAAQRLEIYLKEKKNIKLNDVRGHSDALPENKTVSQQLQESFFGKL